MKRIIALALVCFFMLTSFSLFPAGAADNGFEIKDGILLKYTGGETSVTLPSSVKAVGDSAFENNVKIVSVSIPSSVDAIGDRAFCGCSALKTVTGGSGVTEAGVHAFKGTPYFEESTDEFLMLGKTLLWYNGDSYYITLPSSCLSIAPYAFLRCKTAKMIRSSSDIVSVGAGAFYDCSQLTSVDLPSSVTYIGPYAFDGTPFIKTLGEFAVLGDGILVKYNGTSAEVGIPDSVRRIAAHAFVSSKMTSVSIPSSVYSIDASAFADCVGLRSITFSDGLMMIGDRAFAGCTSLNELVTPPTLAYIGQYAFNAAALTNIRLRGSDLIISENAFKDCTSMRYALLSENVGSLYDNAFAGCTGLGGISIPASAASVSSSALSGCGSVTVICPYESEARSSLSSHKMNNVIGDADTDGELSILDATAIQCYVAQILDYNGAQAAASDYDFNGEINILDAADVQLSLAHIV